MWHHDDAHGHGAFTPQVATASGVVNIVYMGGHAPHVRPGARVAVSAWQLDTQTAVAYAAGSTTTTTSGSTGSTTPLGQLNVAVILGNFANSTTSLDPNVAKAAFQGNPGSDVDSWYSAASYGKSSLAPSFFGPYTISDTTSSGSCPSLSTAGNHLMSTASADLTYSHYQRIIMVFNCSGYGASTNIGQTQVSTPQGAITGDAILMDSSFLGDKYGYAHELSHNLGNEHAAFFECAPDAFTPPTRFGENCASAEYGNEFDTLGSTLTSPRATPFLDPYHADNAGWFSAGNYVTVATPGTYTYKLLPYETPTSGLLALKIPRGSSATAFTLEYRQPIGFDAWMASSNTTYCGGRCTATQGPMIQLVYPQSGPGGGSDTQAIDTTPGSIPSSNYYQVPDNRDGALLPGKTFTDPEFGISITTQSADSTGATVQVTIPGSASCTRSAPTVRLVSSATQTATPGQSLTYTVSVTDNDSAPCPPNDFRYVGGRLMGFTSGGAQGMFTATASPDVFTLSPGASTSVAVTLKPDSTVTAGAYSFQLSSGGGIGTISPNSLGSPNAPMPNVTFQLTSASDTRAPSTPGTLSAQVLGPAAVALSWTPSTDDTSVAGYEVVVDNGSIYYTSSPAFTRYVGLSAGSSHTFSVQAFDYAGNLSAAATATVTTPTRTDTTAPSVVGGLVASATDRSVTIDWKPSTDNTGVIGYYVSPFDKWVPAGSTSLTVTGVATNTPYEVHVQAQDASGNASASASSSMTVTTAAAGSVAPTQPTQVYSPSATSTNGIRLTWNASSDPAGVVGYRVYRNGRRVATVTGTSYTDPASKLYPSTSYAYYVQAYDAAGNVSAPTTAPSMISPKAPGSDTAAPSSAVLSAPSDGSTVSGSVALSAGVADNVGVTRVQFITDGVLLAQATSPFSYTWNTLTAYNGSHSVYVRAYDAAGNFSTTALAALTVDNGGSADTTPPTAPASVTATAASSTQVNLTWSPSTDNSAVMGYNVYRNGSKVAAVTGTSWSDTAAAAAVTYSYFLTAFDAAGNISANSNTASVTTPAATTPPPATGSVSGVVSDSKTGAALGGVKVTATVNGTNLSYSTDSTGHYTVANLPPGSYTLTYTLKGHKSKQATTTVTAGQCATVNVAM